MSSIIELDQELAQANRHIVEARARMARQREIMRRLEAAGHNARRAKHVFRELEDGLEAMLAHHQHIARELAKANT
jgi:hypothetical protein